MSARTWVAAAVLGLFTNTSALADILFIDLNFSSSEVAAARRAATARGEKLIVIPEIPEKERAALDAMNAKARVLLEQLEAATNEFRLIRPSKSGSTQKIEQLSERIDTLSERHTTLERDLVQKLDSFKIAHQSAVEQQIRAAKTRAPITSVIISGHHAGFEYAGSMGKLDEEKIISLLGKEFPRNSSLKSVYLWGCYTNTVEHAKRWSSEVPSLKLIGGFDNSAPSNTNPASPKLLESSLKKEKILIDKGADATSLNKKAVKGLIAAFQNVPAFTESPAAYCISGTYITNKGVQSLVGTRSCPPEVVAKANNGHKLLKAYLDATPGHEMVPEDTARSPLRDYYTLLRQNADCREIVALADSDAEVAIRLIFFKTVWSNFQGSYAGLIRRINAVAAELGYGKLIPDLQNSKTLRKDVLKLTARLSQLSQQKPGEKSLLMKLKEAFKSKKANKSESEFLSLIEHMADNLKTMQTLKEVPIHWIEPGGGNRERINERLLRELIRPRMPRPRPSGGSNENRRSRIGENRQAPHPNGGGGGIIE